MIRGTRAVFGGLALLAAQLGCSAAPEPAGEAVLKPEPLILRCGGKQATVEVRQDDREVLPAGKTYRLEPRPFVLRIKVRGSVEDVSLRAEVTGGLEPKLKALKDQPLVFFAGTGVAYDGRELLAVDVHDDIAVTPILFDADAKSLVEQQFCGKQEAEKHARSLKAACGAVPALATFGHAVVRGESVAHRGKLKDGWEQADFTASRMLTIKDQADGSQEEKEGFRPVRLFVFLRERIDPKDNMMFTRVAWKVVSLEFKPAAAKPDAPPAGKAD